MSALYLFVLICLFVDRDKIGELPGKEFKDCAYRRLFLNRLDSISYIVYSLGVA